MIANVRRGDTVVTSGGLIGKVAKVVDENELQLEIAEGVRVRVVRGMIAEVRAKGEPVKERADVRRMPAKSLGPKRCFIFRAGSPRHPAGRSRRLRGGHPEFLLQGDRLPRWPGLLPKRQLVLGLDLQGGAYLALRGRPHRLRRQAADARWSATSASAMLQEPRINYYRASATIGNARAAARPRPRRGSTTSASAWSRCAIRSIAEPPRRRHGQRVRPRPSAMTASSG